MLEALSTNDPLHVTAVCSDAIASLIEALELLDKYDGTITAPTARLWIMYMDMVNCGCRRWVFMYQCML